MKFEYMIKFSENSGNRCATTDCWIGKNWLSLYIFTLSKIKALTFCAFSAFGNAVLQAQAGDDEQGFSGRTGGLCEAAGASLPCLKKNENRKFSSQEALTKYRLVVV